MKGYSLEELKQYDGREGRKAYIAYDGSIYDVTDSFLWQGGKHQASHHAGENLTDMLKKAPHGVDFVKRFPVVGYLLKE